MLFSWFRNSRQKHRRPDRRGTPLAGVRGERLELRCLLAVEHVIQISVDGLASVHLEPMVQQQRQEGNADLEAFLWLEQNGSFTYNARTDASYTNTLPNHVSMLTGRPVLPPPGMPPTIHHNWTSNVDPAAGVTLHSNHPDVEYLPSVFDVVHDHGGRTALLVGKAKLGLFQTSYDTAHGAPDAWPENGDQGHQKIDTFQLDSKMQRLAEGLLDQLQRQPPTYAMLHLADPDRAGHRFGWGSPAWIAAVQSVDQIVGQIIDAITRSPTLANTTALVLTADHGGQATGHFDSQHLDNYKIPLFVWAPSLPHGADLYQVYAATTTDPGNAQPSYAAPEQPIRNGDTANLVLDLLQLPPINGAPLNRLHRCRLEGPDGCATGTNSRPEDPLDVNADGHISPLDALLVINALNDGQGGAIAAPALAPPYLDVDGDQYLAPIDALLILNHLNRQASPGATPWHAPVRSPALTTSRSLSPAAVAAAMDQWDSAGNDGNEEDEEDETDPFCSRSIRAKKLEAVFPVIIP